MASYSLTLSQSKQYVCTVTAAPLYVQAMASLQGGSSTHLTLDFTTAPPSACVASQPSAPKVACGALALVPGKVSGQVIYADTGADVTTGTVGCTEMGQHGELPLVSTIGFNGAYLIPAPAGIYWCVATGPANQIQGHQVTVDPATTSSLNFRVCLRSCPRVTFHGVQVMHAYRVYVIFWLPAGSSLEPGGSDSRYETLIESYFRDVGGTPFFGLLTQYFDLQGPVLNQASLVGVDVDTSPYQHCLVISGPCTSASARQSDPLLDNDIQAEVQRVRTAKGWSADGNTEYMVFGAAGAQACAADTVSAAVGCTYVQNNSAVCGWHGSYEDPTAANVMYAYIADPQTTPDVCIYGTRAVGQVAASPPNGDWAAAAAIDVTSHEQFESITDPIALGGWFNTSLQGSGEIGDLCEGVYPNLQPNGSDIALNHGGHFIVQAEWSDAAGGCALSA